MDTEVMNDFTYPTLRIAVLQGLKELKERFSADPSILKVDTCPYDPDTIEVLTQILTPETIKVVERVQVEAPKEAEQDGLLNADERELVADTVSSLLKQLNTLGEGEAGLDTQTKVQIIKAKATLIDQMLRLHERIMNIKRLANFHATVFSILDDYVDEAGRAAVLKRMEPYRYD